MLIANPIYDSVFKYLLEDLKAAKSLISRILGETVEVLQFCPQEFSDKIESLQVTIFRLDFKAVILHADGTRSKVLIEMQKAKEHFDIMRFRHYLGDNYGRTDVVDGREVQLPIVTIYFLGFKLSVPAPVLKVGRVYTDATTGKVIHGRDEFVEHLTHDSHVVQIPRLRLKHKSRIERLLSVFSQRWKKDGEKDWTLQYVPEPGEENDEDLQCLLRRLGEAAGDEKLRNKVRMEKELERTILNKMRKMERKLAQKDTIIEQKDQALTEKDQVIGQQEQALTEKDQALIEKDRLIEEEKRRNLDLEERLHMLMQGKN